MIRESEYGNDLKFSREAMMLMHNADLANNLGNVVNRAVNLCKEYNAAVPKFSDAAWPDATRPFDLKAVRASFMKHLSRCELAAGAEVARQAAADTNEWIASLEPWKVKKDSPAKAEAMIRILIESIYVLGHLFAPFTPCASEAIFKKLHTEAVPIDFLKADFLNLTEGNAVASESVLFRVMDAAGGGAGAGASGSAAGGAAPAAAVEAFGKVDFRVGKIVECEPHPEAERLFIEKIDVGEAEPRQILSGLREHYKQEEMVGKTIVAICNLKPRKMVGVQSHGMVLCAKEDTKVVFAELPAGAKPGDSILLEGMGEAEKKPLEPKKLEKEKAWEAVAGKLKTDCAGSCCFDGVPLVVSGKRLTAPFKNAILS